MRYPMFFFALAATVAQAQDHRHPSSPDGPSGQRPAAVAAVPGTAGQPPVGRREWTRYPLLLPVMGRGMERTAAMLKPVGIEAGSLAVFAGDGPTDRRQVEYPVGPEGARIEAASPQVGNYHWVVARQATDGAVRVASTAWYFGNPGASPAGWLPQRRHEFEIIPEPLPREHAAYRESEKWRFLVRMNGVPLPAQPVVLETEFGSRSSFVTDGAGYATVLFPRDFRPPQPGQGMPDGHGPRRAKFVLAAEKEEGGTRYLTAFNHHYGQDGDRNRSVGWGALFGVVGMAAATPLLRRRVTMNGEGEVRG